jgi:drug/metabolite transporter (DMT)-like permease
VRVSETGPVATAFWRAFLALPFLFAWAAVSARRSPVTVELPRGTLVAAGLFFAGDLAVWHVSLMLTTVTTSTLLANLAPVFVTLGVWLILGQRPSRGFLTGMVVGLAGVFLLMGADFRTEGKALLGDALGLVTAVFYGCYQFTVSRLRTRLPTAVIMAWSCTITAAALFPLAWYTNPAFFPATGYGWLKLLGLAVIAQAGAQSLIAYALAHLPATFSSVGLLLQPVIATGFAAVFVDEIPGPMQFAGAAFVLAGIWLAHRASTEPMALTPSAPVVQSPRPPTTDQQNERT